MDMRKFNFIKNTVSELFNVHKITGSVYGYRFECSYLNKKIKIEIIAFNKHCEMGQVTFNCALVNNKDFDNKINELSRKLWAYSE